MTSVVVSINTMERVQCSEDAVTLDPIELGTPHVNIVDRETGVARCVSCTTAEDVQKNADAENFTRDPVYTIFGTRGQEAEISDMWEQLVTRCGIHRPDISLFPGPTHVPEPDAAGAATAYATLRDRYMTKKHAPAARYVAALHGLVGLYKYLASLDTNTQSSADASTRLAKDRASDVAGVNGLCGLSHYPFQLPFAASILLVRWAGVVPDRPDSMHQSLRKLPITCIEETIEAIHSLLSKHEAPHDAGGVGTSRHKHRGKGRELDAARTDEADRGKDAGPRRPRVASSVHVQPKTPRASGPGSPDHGHAGAADIDDEDHVDTSMPAMLPWQELGRIDHKRIIDVVVRVLNSTGQELEVRPSTIPGISRDARYGVFATKRLNKGSVVATYRGEAIDAAEYAVRYPDDRPRYVLGLGRGRYLDASDPRRAGVARFINDPGPGRKPNVAIVTSRGKRLVRTLRTVLPGEELLVDYGPKYHWHAGERKSAPTDSRSRTAARARHSVRTVTV